MTAARFLAHVRTQLALESLTRAVPHAELAEARDLRDRLPSGPLNPSAPPHQSGGECAPNVQRTAPAGEDCTSSRPFIPRVAQPNWSALGLGSADEAEGRN